MSDQDNRRLGKGLGAIFGDDLSSLIDEIQQQGDESYGRKQTIELSKIVLNPYQPRKEFDQDKLIELAKSIEQYGVFTPILVRETINGYQLIAGERRVRASEEIGLETIPAIIVDFSDEMMLEIALLENIQRENLSVIEEATAYSTMLKKLGYTQEKVAVRVSKSREHVANLLRLLRLPAEVQDLVHQGQLTMGHVRPLIPLEDEAKIISLAHKIKDEKLSVREVEQLIKQLSSPTKTIEKEPIDKYLVDLKHQLESKLQTAVKIDSKQLIIKYQGTSDLNRILAILNLLDDIDN